MGFESYPVITFHVFTWSAFMRLISISQMRKPAQRNLEMISAYTLASSKGRAECHPGQALRLFLSMALCTTKRMCLKNFKCTFLLIKESCKSEVCGINVKLLYGFISGGVWQFQFLQIFP